MRRSAIRAALFCCVSVTALQAAAASAEPQDTAKLTDVPLSEPRLSEPRLSEPRLQMAQAPADEETVPEERDRVGFEEEEAAAIEEIVVRGSFVRSVRDSIDIKRQSDQIVEAISAQDIGRLPDISIAEALARLPGITSQRTSGQSSAINVRGLSQQLTFSTLNGREQVTPNGNRAVEFEQFPSELIEAALVYKSPEAALIEGGLAGTVELRTVRPLARDGRSINLNVRGSFNDRADEIFDANEFGYRASGSYVDQFADGTLGVSIGYARLVQPDVATRFVGFDYAGAQNDFNGDGEPDAVSFGFELEEAGGTETRDGIIGTIQWQPTPAIDWSVDAYYSRFESESFGRGIRIIGTQEINSGNTTVDNPAVVNDAVIGGRFSRNIPAPTVMDGGFGLTGQGINDNNFDEDELVSVGSKLAYTTERFDIGFDFTFSRGDSFFANEVSAILPLSSLDGGVAGAFMNDNPNTPVLDEDLTVDYRLRGLALPTVNAISQDFTNRNEVFLSRFGLFPFDNEDELFAYAADAEYITFWPVISAIEAGVRYSDRTAQQVRTSADFGNDAGFFQFAPPLPPIALTEENSSVECFSGDFADAGFPCFLVVPDPRPLVEDVVGEIQPDQSQFFTQTESFVLSEEVIAGYIQANIDTQIGSLPVTGNVGLRIVHTEQFSKSEALELGTGIDFTDYLPSLNLILRLTDNDLIRLGASRAIARPPLSQLGAGFNISFDQTQQRLVGGGQGNPALKPTLANAGDISYEHYFDNGGIFTIAGFWKELETFIVVEEDDNFNFAAAGFLGFLSEEDRALLEASGVDLVGSFTGPINGDGGNIKGIELGYTQAFEFLPAPFDGLGVVLNYAYTDSEVSFTSARSGLELTFPLPGLSDHVVNGTVFYEKAGFSTRVGVRYRSEFISPQVGIDRQLPFTAAEVVVDWQGSYEFGASSVLEGLTLLFQANNLTDTPVTTFFGTEAQTGTRQFFGRQFFFGASYSF